MDKIWHRGVIKYLHKRGKLSGTKMGPGVPIRLGSKDSSIAGGIVWTERETLLKKKSVLALVSNRTMVELQTFQLILLGYMLSNIRLK